MEKYKAQKHFKISNSSPEQEQIASHYLTLMQEVTQSSTSYNIDKDIKELKDLLSNLRKTVSEQIKQDIDIKILWGLYQYISADMIHRNNEAGNESPDYHIRPGSPKQSLPGILARAYQQAEQDLLNTGIKRPCDYAVIGLGSMALQQATPYSDLEFAIIVDHEDVEVEKYFEDLTHLVHFRIIQLGETGKGVCFDTWHKTPFGKEGEYKLIRTKEGFLKYLKNEDRSTQKIDPLLHAMLETTCFVYGKEELFTKYNEAACAFMAQDHKLNEKNKFWDKFLYTNDDTNKEYLGSENTPKNKKQKAAESLRTQYENNLYEIENFLVGKQTNQESIKIDVKKEHVNEEPTKIDVKDNIYRIIDRALYSYAGAKGWFQGSVFKLLNNLHDGEKKKDVDSNIYKYLSYMVCFALKLRLFHHDFYNGREEKSIDMTFFKSNKLDADLESYKNNATSFLGLITEELRVLGLITEENTLTGEITKND